MTLKDAMLWEQTPRAKLPAYCKQFSDATLDYLATALALTTRVQKDPRFVHSELLLTGHSLGAGLAGLIVVLANNTFNLHMQRHAMDFFLVSAVSCSVYYVGWERERARARARAVCHDHTIFIPPLTLQLSRSHTVACCSKAQACCCLFVARGACSNRKEVEWYDQPLVD
jgi:hypothetical protein